MWFRQKGYFKHPLRTRPEPVEPIDRLSYRSPQAERCFDFDLSNGPEVWFIQVQSAVSLGISAYLKVLAGIEEAPKGEALLINNRFFTGQDFYDTLSWRLQIAYSFDQGGLIYNRSLWDNLMLPLQYHEGWSFSIEQFKKEVLAHLPIDWDWSLRPAYVSGRVRKKIILIRSLTLNPRVLVLDDPWLGLDPPFVRAFHQLLIHWVQQTQLRFIFCYDSQHLNGLPYNRFLRLLPYRNGEAA